jgi:hypothetical protein
MAFAAASMKTSSFNSTGICCCLPTPLIVAAAAAMASAAALVPSPLEPQHELQLIVFCPEVPAASGTSSSYLTRAAADCLHHYPSTVACVEEKEGSCLMSDVPGDMGSDTDAKLVEVY